MLHYSLCPVFGRCEKCFMCVCVCVCVCACMCLSECAYVLRQMRVSVCGRMCMCTRTRTHTHTHTHTHSGGVKSRGGEGGRKGGASEDRLHGRLSHMGIALSHACGLISSRRFSESTVQPPFKSR